MRPSDHTPAGDGWADDLQRQIDRAVEGEPEPPAGGESLRDVLNRRMREHPRDTPAEPAGEPANESGE